MNCYNGARYLRQALDSVFAQTFTDWEIVFWDNASCDESPDIARSYGEKLRYHRSPATTMLGEARNRAFSQARGEYVAMLDVDDLWLPGKLARQVPILDTDQSVGLAYCGAVLFDDQGNEKLFFDRQTPCRGWCFDDLLRRNFICTGSMLFRASALEAISPLFEPDMTMVMDYYLTLRLAAGWQFDFDPEALVRHRIHGESESSRKWHRFSSELRLAFARLPQQLGDVVNQHAVGVEAASRAAALQYALDVWTLGKSQEARNALRPYVGRSAAHTLIFLMCWIYRGPLPAEKLRRLKYRLKSLCGKSRAPFRSYRAPKGAD
jgi:glycosyltransferase involved in cell wall biosynthesis